MIDNHSFSTLLSKSPKDAKARLLSCGGAHGSLILKAPLSRNRGFRLTNCDFGNHLSLLLGSTNVSIPNESCKHCNKLMGDNGTGYHCQICKYGDLGPVARHNEIRDIVYNYAQKAVLYPRKEVPLNTATKKTPGDIYFAVGASGKPTAFDFTLVHPWSVRVIDGSSVTVGYAAKEAERRKNTKYLDDCASHGVKFIPVGIESFGYFSDSLIDLIQWIATGIANRTGTARSIIITEIRRKILFAILRSYSGAIQSRVGNRTVGF